jgi:hypothetical protein
MAKTRGPLFSLEASGSFGPVVYDKRGIARVKTTPDDPQTPQQGNQRQIMSTAQRCVKLCGPNTREQLKQVARPRSQWHSNLIKNFIGDDSAHYQDNLAVYGNGVDQAAWETAAEEIGMNPVQIDYATAEPVSPGTQLFMLASTLYDFDIYPELGHPAGSGNPTSDVEGWKQSIIS